MINDGVIPVVHLGQTAAVEALTAVTSLSWLVISLECPRPVAVARIQERATGDTRARLSAWDHTAPLTAPDLAVNTLLLSARSSSTHPRRA
jgi:guanylate kinase